MSSKKKMTIGLIVGNRGFFPGSFSEERSGGNAPDPAKSRL